MKKLKKALSFAQELLHYFHKGWKAHLMRHYLSSFFHSLFFHLNQFRIDLCSEEAKIHHIEDEKVKKLRITSLGLHSLLPKDPLFSYSILLPIKEPKPIFLKECLDSILYQSAPSLEILIGFISSPSKEIQGIISHFQKQFSKCQTTHLSSNLAKEEALNELAKKATGQFLLIMEEDDWIRPDFFLRFEQTMRLFEDPQNYVLYSNWNLLNDRGYFIPRSEYKQPRQLHFPFFFQTISEKGWLIPAKLWKEVKGFDLDCKGASHEDLLLRLDLCKAKFQHIPLCLYSVHTNRKKESKSEKDFLEALERYSKRKKLNWQWSSGHLPYTAKAIPSLSSNPLIQVIIPYQDQKKLTLQCIESILKQENVSFKITAIDNRSKDSSIRDEIQSLGGEVLVIDEPFNYSRLNNLAVKQTQKAKDCDILLFLNNDVEMQADALSEMLRWINEPEIGLVGARLHYPDGRLQHGGVSLNLRSRQEMRWEHIEKFLFFEEMKKTKILGIFDAVTAACAMMKKEAFLAVGGFDEIWYPIGYSDTNLASKLRAKGLKCFYTPYAVGIHYESVSRKQSIEDYENSWWLYDLQNH